MFSIVAVFANLNPWVKLNSLWNLNPLNSNIYIYILHTALYTISAVYEENLLVDHFLFLITFMFEQCYHMEKFSIGHSQGLKGNSGFSIH